MNVTFQEMQRALNRQGYAVARQKFTRGYLSNLLQVDTLIDVGVGHGTPPLHVPEIAKKFILIDPQPIPQSVCQSIEEFGGQAVTKQTALGTEATTLELVVHRNMNHTNLLHHTDTFAALESPAEGITTTQVEPLDDVITNLNVDLGRFGVKIDTEGYEKNVLLGGMKTLKSAEFVIIEVSIKRRFRESYKPSEIIKIMSECNLEIADILNISLKTPWYMDMLFFPWNSEIFDEPK